VRSGIDVRTGPVSTERDRNDGLRGIEAVVDKDTPSQLLATSLGAETLAFLTDIAFACVNDETPDQRPLRRVTAEELRTHLDAGEAGDGSMQPTVKAYLRFVGQGGGQAVVTAPGRLLDALAGETGTQGRA
jgi:carbamate kinase